MVVKKRHKESRALATENTDKELDARFSKWIEELGGAECIREEDALYRARWERMTDRYDDLVKKYPDQWIAIAEREEPYVAGSSKELIAILDEEGIDRNAAVMKFIRARRRRRII